MAETLWKPLDTVDEAIDRYASQAVTMLTSADKQRHTGDLDVYYLPSSTKGHSLTAITYLLRALKDGTDPDEAAAMVPTLLDPTGPARTWADILTPTPTDQS